MTALALRGRESFPSVKHAAGRPEDLPQISRPARQNARLEWDDPRPAARPERFLKVGERAADNHNMGHTPRLQERAGS